MTSINVRILSLLLLLFVWIPDGISLSLASADEISTVDTVANLPQNFTPEEAAGGPVTTNLPKDATPLAGKPYHTQFLGHPVGVPSRDRSRLTAVTLGAAYGTPKVGNVDLIPIFNLFLKRYWTDSRTRDSISIFVNDIEYEKGPGPLELVARFENVTLPVASREVFNNREIKSSSLYTGTATASVGPGLRFRIPPYEVDNDVRLQLLGNVGYFYAKKSSDTGSDVVRPPSTMLYGATLRGRYDGMVRNILELPHRGTAAGFDLDFTHRGRWEPYRTSGNSLLYTRDYLQFTGYGMAVAGIPGLTEKNRLLASVSGGSMKRSSADRFNAFRVSGGPYPTETDDLARPDYEGTMFNDIQMSDYFVAALEYRRQLSFFSYLGIRGSYITADEATLSNANDIEFKRKDGLAATATFDSGFFWDSSVRISYSYDFGFVRYGKPGSGILVLWNKQW